MHDSTLNESKIIITASASFSLAQVSAVEEES